MNLQGSAQLNLVEPHAHPCPAEPASLKESSGAHIPQGHPHHGVDQLGQRTQQCTQQQIEHSAPQPRAPHIPPNLQFQLDLQRWRRGVTPSQRRRELGQSHLGHVRVTGRDTEAG